MRFTLDGKELGRAIKLLSKISKGSSMPILYYIHVRTEKVGSTRAVFFTATDLKITGRIGYEDESPENFQAGTACIDAKKFSGVISGLLSNENTGSITVEVAKRIVTEGGEVRTLFDGDVSVSFNGKTMTLQYATVDSLEYPVFPNLNGATVVPVGNWLVRDLEVVAHSMSKEDTRPHLAGALVHVEHGERAIVSTDGHRLTAVEGAGSSEKSFTGIFYRRLVELMPYFNKMSPVESLLSEKETEGACGSGWVLMQRRNENVFPNYKQVIPEEEGLAICESRDFAKDFEQASGLIGDAGVCLRFKPEGASLESASASEVKFSELVQWTVRKLDGERHVGVDIRYMADAAKACKGQYASLHVRGELDPIKMTWVEEGRRCTAVVMPMRI